MFHSFYLVASKAVVPDLRQRWSFQPKTPLSVLGLTKRTCLFSAIRFVCPFFDLTITEKCGKLYADHVIILSQESFFVKGFLQKEGGYAWIF